MSLATIRGHLRSSFRALGHRNYRLYWTGQLISLIGTWMQSVAQGWLMHRLTGSALMLGFLGFAQFLPVPAFAVGGRDRRFDRETPSPARSANRVSDPGGAACGGRQHRCRAAQDGP